MLAHSTVSETFLLTFFSVRHIAPHNFDKYDHFRELRKSQNRLSFQTFKHTHTHTAFDAVRISLLLQTNAKKEKMLRYLLL